MGEKRKTKDETEQGVDCMIMVKEWRLNDCFVFRLSFFQLICKASDFYVKFRVTIINYFRGEKVM